jgi:Family of unknown function (DUF6328)
MTASTQTTGRERERFLSPDAGGDPGRDETREQRLDRNTNELVGEMRVAAIGIQVMFAFLLVVPFNAGWKHVSSFERDVYFVALLCIAIAAVLLIAPTIHHRLLFRLRQKEYLVDMGSRCVIVAMCFLAVGLVAILVLISDFLFGAAAAVVVGLGTAFVVGTLWFATPLTRRRKIESSDRRPGSSRTT